ncbi:HAMP domain-containing histidine kinase [Cyanobacterium stanieri LEGE 03274]|uniref:histidine kinase n=1 Tax=Cyanobacterium stanieri LEGE 03274 TaxID=1828756 RepID=A0ABR9V1G6_9CHRO|nr:HAMP domain-containing sensor histidine kinase [Cyanobacterium stanieri]MBE9221730.1 HAMP domain-containing histidine kinase [Cyanobacterium stanieri LEGE 03274]
MAEYEGFFVSKEFISLCESQLILLAQNLAVQESAIYLTEKVKSDEPRLIPVIVYPFSRDEDSNDLLLLPESEDGADFEFNLMEESDSDLNNIINYIPDSASPYQLLLPLIHDDSMVGLLATNRGTKPWGKREVLQVKEVAQTIIFARLLDQKQQISEQQLKAYQQLQNLQNDHLDDFFHQLRNPLTAIRTFGKLLIKRLVGNDRNYTIAQSIVREGDRLLDLIEDFSEDWKVVNNSPHPSLKEGQSTSFFLTENIQKLEKIDLKQLIQPLITGIDSIAQDRNITFMIDIDDNLPAVSSNPKALTEILNNLLDNAVKYTPEGGKICLEIVKQKSTNQGEKIVIEISDTGYGIPPEDQKHIFERHYRGVQENSDIYGTGLGLAIVKELCDKMSIDIEIFSPSFWIKNQQLNGTTFSLFIPIAS